MILKSEITELGRVTFPEPSGIRVMMMPFLLEDLATIPWRGWRAVIAGMFGGADRGRGIAYLTIDEATVRRGETHRRPGKHVDGCGAWGSPTPKPWARRGMILASSHVGCRGWNGTYAGTPGADGECDDIAVPTRDEVVMQPGVAYRCAPTAIHESLPMRTDTMRQLCRVSMPSDEAWFDGYTESPFGVKPTGEIRPMRSRQMAFRHITPRYVLRDKP